MTEDVLREAKEEVGLTIKLADDLRPFEEDTEEYKELIPPKFMNMNKISDAHRHVTLTYFATTDTDEVKPESPNDQWKWVTAAELDTMDLRPSIRFYAKRALEELGSIKI